MTQDSELIEKALEPVRQLLLQKSQASTQEQGKEYQYKIDEDLINEIQKDIVDKVDRFNTWEDFVKEAITNTMDFWTKPKRMMEMGGELWPSFTSEMKDEIKKNVPEFYYQMEESTKKRNEIAEMIQHISSAKAGLSKEEFSVPKNIVLGDAYSLMHQSYNRFFPLKILVTTLALMIKENKTRWIDYIEFSEKAFDTALEFSDSLKAIKPGGKKAKRNIRISTGLPISHERDPASPTSWEDKIEKDEKSKQRFFDCYVGPKALTFQRMIETAEREFTHSIQSGDPKWVFSGALNETGLVHISDIEGHLEITLSKLGFEFFALDNPLISGIKISCGICKACIDGCEFDCDEKTIFGKGKIIYDLDKKTFSNKEIDFIEKKIIPRFKLEKIIVEDVLDSMKNKSEVDTEHLDKVIKKTIKKWVVENKTKAVDEKIMTVKEGNIVFDEDKVHSYRIATMGRLAEIGKVNWEIKKGNSGKAESFYSIPT